MNTSDPTCPPECTNVPDLKSLISEIAKKLPPIEYSRLASSEIDYYGASNTISRELKLEGIPYTRASWHHGWNRYPLVEPELFIHQGCVAFCEVRKVPNLVATKPLEIFLRGKNYPLAKAVGDPFIYTSEANIERIPNSLLLVPWHSIKEANSKHFQSSKKLLFPEKLSILKKRFSTIVACIGAFCVQRNNYIKHYEDAGIPWITGAWLHDAYALQRIRNLFSQFEYVSTNSIGSHIPYAGYCGCKVSYYGNGQNLDPKDFLEIPVYKQFPKLIKIIINENRLEKLKEKYSFLFSTIENSLIIKEWSMQVLGAQNQLPPEDIAKLIGWKIRQKGENSWEYIPRANPGVVMKN